MKNIIKPVITLFLIFMFLSPVYSQGNFYNYTNANISFWYPDNWMVREHILLLLMPKAENLQIQFQLSEKTNLNDAVRESMNELKLLYPDDSAYIVKDYTLNKLKIKNIDGVIQNNKVNYFLVQTLDDKVIKITYIVPEDIDLKYKDEIQKIIKSLKPIN